MILTDKDILSGSFVYPLTETNVQPTSVDLTLDTHFLIPDVSGKSRLTLYKDKMPMVELEKERFFLDPHSFCLASTVEEICVDSEYSAFVEGKSTIGRYGLFIQNAGWVDSGFKGRITLELFNASPFRLELTAGDPICQLVIVKNLRAVGYPYNGRYQGQMDVTPARVDK